MKEQIIKIFKDLKTNRLDKGLTSVKFIKKDNAFSITHRGNMGNSIEKSIDPNLKSLGLPTVGELKNVFRLHLEEGSPDYMYSIIFKM